MKKTILVLVGLLTAACVGTSQNAKFYSLRPEAAVAVAELKTIIGIGDIELPNYLDKPQIVTTSHNALELKASEFNRWSESLSAIMQRVLADDLASALPKSLVKVKTDSREEFKYLIKAEVNQFDGSWDGDAVLEVWWQVVKADGTIVMKKRTRLTQPAGSDYISLVEAQSRLVAAWAEEIAASLKNKA